MVEPDKQTSSDSMKGNERGMSVMRLEAERPSERAEDQTQQHEEDS